MNYLYISGKDNCFASLIYGLCDCYYYYQYYDLTCADTMHSAKNCHLNSIDNNTFSLLFIGFILGSIGVIIAYFAVKKGK